MPHLGHRSDILRRADMDLAKVLAQLRRELADLDAAIASLEQLPQARPRRGYASKAQTQPSHEDQASMAGARPGER